MAEDVFATDQGSSEESALDALVGEGKKFGDVEALAQGKAKSDAHIATIEQENATLKGQLESLTQQETKETQVKDLLDAVKAGAKEGSEGGQTMSQEELTKVVQDIYQGEKSADTKAANRAKGNSLVLGKVEGNVEAARTLVAERAQALGMSVEALAGLSETSPDAFAALITQGDSTANSSGSLQQLPNQSMDALNSSAPVLEADGFKTKAWFDAKRKEVGVAKYINDPSIQGELVKSMNGLGERFNN